MLGKNQTSAQINMCGILHTGLAFLKHICKKSNMCGKNYHVSLIITLSSFDGNKDLAHFSKILFDLLSLSWNVYNLIYDLNFLVPLVWFGLLFEKMSDPTFLNFPRSPRPPLSLQVFEKNRLSKLIFFHIICYLRFNSVRSLCLHSTKKNTQPCRQESYGSFFSILFFWETLAFPCCSFVLSFLHETETLWRTYDKHIFGKVKVLTKWHFFLNL